MPDRTYQLTEVVGTSSEGLTRAIENGIAKVASAAANISWFEVTQIRGHVAEGKVAYYQVQMKVGHGL